MTAKLWKAARCIASASAFLVLVVIVFGSHAGSQASTAPDRQNTQPYRVSVDLNLVVLNATVRDRQGRFVSGLHEQDFGVYEDGVRQSLRLFEHEDVPVTVGLIVDHSGSMQPKLGEVTGAARSFVQFSNPQDEMFVVNFNETVALGLPGAIRFTNNPVELEGAIWRTAAMGETALYDAVVSGLQQLQEGSRDKKVLVVISDGGDNASTHSLAQVTSRAAESSAMIYTIGLFEAGDPDRNPAVLHRLAQATGGEAFFPGEIGEVTAICEGIARDIRNQYTLGYVSTNTAQTPASRSIRVVARAAGRGKLSVRTRTGYRAGGGPR
ncbi:MAG: VWA domain-containing protein [Acidobacteriia bacterium]|nr:VWA domain-containing protein [Terriglobia bacterium]